MSSKKELFDPLRQRYVVATPEEVIRQKLLLQMIGPLGYPKELLAVEKALSQLPHLENIADLPERRADIICFSAGIHPEFLLYPLLLIECKEGEAGQEAIDQVLGYNHFVQAPFVAIAGKRTCQLVYPEVFNFLPSYSELLAHACCSL